MIPLPEMVLHLRRKKRELVVGPDGELTYTYLCEYANRVLRLKGYFQDPPPYVKLVLPSGARKDKL